MYGSFYRTKNLTPATIVYIFQGKIRSQNGVLLLFLCWSLVNPLVKFLAFIDFKIVYTVLWGKCYYLLFNLCATYETLQIYYYSITICISNSDALHSLVPPVQIFVSRSFHSTCMKLNNSHFLRAPNTLLELHSENFFFPRNATFSKRLSQRYCHEYNILI